MGDLPADAEQGGADVLGLLGHEDVAVVFADEEAAQRERGDGGQEVLVDFGTEFVGERQEWGFIGLWIGVHFVSRIAVARK